VGKELAELVRARDDRGALRREFLQRDDGRGTLDERLDEGGFRDGVVVEVPGGDVEARPGRVDFRRAGRQQSPMSRLMCLLCRDTGRWWR
jgi:hypothetical protein